MWQLGHAENGLRKGCRQGKRSCDTITSTKRIERSRHGHTGHLSLLGHRRYFLVCAGDNALSMQAETHQAPTRLNFLASGILLLLPSGPLLNDV